MRKQAKWIPFVFALLLHNMPALAQSWPDRPIRLYVPQGAGGGQDSIARYLSDKASAILGQPIIIDNRPGAGGIIGTQAAARATPDGYNFAFTSSATMASNPHLVKNLPYDPLNDFIPVAMISKPGFLISANPERPFKTLAELIAFEKKSPGSVTVAIDGNRNASGLTAAFLNKTAGINIRLVPYSSPAQGLQDTISGNVDLFISPPGVHLPHIAAGKLRPLAVSGTNREIALPDVPMIGETLPEFRILGWLMISAPKGTPAEPVARMNAAMDRVLRDKIVIDWMQNFGSPAHGGAETQDELRSFVRDEISLWGKMIAEIGLDAQ
jgi:tripartite-type tricarboxylate transporter receptor subunit TctC